MKIFKLLFYLVPVFLIIACQGIKPTSPNPTEYFIKNCEGTFIDIMDQQNFNTLPELLILNYQRTNGSIYPLDTISSSLKLLNEKQLEVIVFKNNVYNSSDTLQGEIKNNSFYIDKQKAADYSDGYLLSFKEIVTSRLSITKERNLAITYKNRFIYRFLMLPVWYETTKIENKSFKRI